MKGISMFLAGLITGIIIAVIAVVMIVPKQMFIVNESKLDFQATVEAIEKSAGEAKWSIPHHYDLQATLKKHGLDVNPVHVYSICKPSLAYKILGSDEERLVSAMMPCRLAVYEKGGKTYVSILNSGFFSKFMSKKIKDVMGDASAETFSILAPIVK